MAIAGISAGDIFVDVVPNVSTFASKLAKGITPSVSAIGATVGAALSLGAFKGLAASVESTTELAGSIKGLQRVTGLAAEDASKLVFVGHELGISAEQLNVGFGLLSKNIVNASSNFTKYDIETTNADGSTRSLTAILGDAADKYVEMGGGIKGTAFALNLFGRSGKALIPILAQGSEGIAEMSGEAERLGVVMSQDDIEAARGLVIAQRELSSAFEGLGVTIGTEVVPFLTTVVHGFTDVVAALVAVPGPIKAGVLGFVALTGALIAVVKVAQILGGVWGPIGRALVGAAVSAYGYVAALISLASTEGIAATASLVLEGAIAALSGPLLPVIAVIGALGLAVAAATGNLGSLTDGFQELSTVTAQAVQAVRLAKASGIQFATALTIVQQAAEGTSPALEKLRSAAEGFDPTALLIETPRVLEEITKFAFGGSKALDQFSKVSGTSVDSIKNDLAGLLTNAKATVGDYIDVIESSQDAWRDWRDSLIDNFGGASGALEAFVGKSRVDFGKAVDSLKSYMDRLREWRQDFRELAKDPASKEFLQSASEGGIEWLGILNSVSDQAPKAREQFFKLFDGANADTASLAGVIQNVLVPKFDSMIEKLKVIANQLGANYDLKVDTSKAQAAVNQFIELNSGRVIPMTITGVLHGGPLTNPPGHAAGAFIPATPGGEIVRVAEGGEGEWILNRAQMDSVRRGSSGAGGRLRLEGNVTLELGGERVEGIMRGWAREEVDGDRRFRETVG